ncbi:MAG: b(o/a)3-type cytochrome-c oxidase subunit 1 [Gammaproteobacteria bacterium]|jgi:cytochrome c oxidase subunit I
MKDNAAGLSLASMWVGFIAFLAAVLMGLYQVVQRIDLIPEIMIPEVYFASVSTHGVLMGFVLTTFLVMGYGYYTATTSLKRELWGKSLGWIGFWLALAGVLIAAVPLLTGNASVLYTFYPPLRANPAFYIGAAMLVVGSWFWCLVMVMSMHVWKKENPGETVPLAMYGTVANAIMWFITSLGVTLEVLFQLIPWSLGISDTVDVGLARTLFSWTLHAIVYFWLFPAYIAFYTLMPKQAGGRLASDHMARLAFIMLLVFSVPIGFHHLYMDPFQAAGWKFLHMTGTFMVAVPTLITGFTVIASMEIAGRLRGGKGLFGWLKTLPWDNPMVLATGLAMLLLTVGGFGGVVNASYSMNAMVHNTQWVTGHFHLIFGGTTVMMYFAIAYYLWPKMTGKELFSVSLARKQLWLWFIGMIVLTLPWHQIGLTGQPRRISSTPYDPELTQMWGISEFLMIVGGVILFISALMLVINLFRTHGNAIPESVLEVEYAQPVHSTARMPHLMNSFTFWFWLVVVYMIASYGYPILQFFLFDQSFGTVPWSI